MKLSMQYCVNLDWKIKVDASLPIAEKGRMEGVMAQKYAMAKMTPGHFSKLSPI